MALGSGGHVADSLDIPPGGVEAKRAREETRRFPNAGTGSRPEIAIAVAAGEVMVLRPLAGDGTATWPLGQQPR